MHGNAGLVHAESHKWLRAGIPRLGLNGRVRTAGARPAQSEASRHLIGIVRIDKTGCAAIKSALSFRERRRYTFGSPGDVAQLGEHRVRIAGVRGSSPLISTNSPLFARRI
jgi:hypothetical protein